MSIDKETYCFSYVKLAKQEEKDMLRKYSNKYRNYKKQVPAFFPSIPSLINNERSTTRRKVKLFRKEVKYGIS